MTTFKMIALALMFCGLCLAQQPTTVTATAPVAEQVAQPVATPIPCTCPVPKPAAKRVKRPVVPPPAPVVQTQTAGINAVPSLPEWILWLATSLFGVMLLAMAFLFGRVTAPQPIPAAPAPVIINIPQQPPSAPAPVGPAAAAPAAPAP